MSPTEFQRLTGAICAGKNEIGSRRWFADGSGDRERFAGLLQHKGRFALCLTISALNRRANAFCCREGYLGSPHETDYKAL
jgi:hypothetical protein